MQQINRTNKNTFLNTMIKETITYHLQNVCKIVSGLCRFLQRKT